MTSSRLPSGFLKVYSSTSIFLYIQIVSAFGFAFIYCYVRACASECWPAAWPVVATIFKDDANCNLTPSVSDWHRQNCTIRMCLLNRSKRFLSTLLVRCYCLYLSRRNVVGLWNREMIMSKRDEGRPILAHRILLMLLLMMMFLLPFHVQRFIWEFIAFKMNFVCDVS